jgi:endonuclease/exonuclease/phosphatase family metal-dependent hydrolase
MPYLRVAVALSFLLPLLTACTPGYHGQVIKTISAFRSRSCTDLPPERLPTVPENICPDGGACTTGPMRVMTYNVLCSFCVKEDYDGWFDRLPYLQEQIAFYAPDLLGLQEPSSALSISALLMDSPIEYGMVYHAAGLLNYPDSAILFRKDKYTLLEWDTFFISALPCAGKREGFLTTAPRYVTWAVLREKASGLAFLFVNSHFDAHRENREKSAEIVTEWLAPIADQIPILFTGDFNSQIDSRAYRTLAGEDSAMRFENAFDHAVRRTSIHNVDGNEDVTAVATYLKDRGKIDHILFAGPAAVDVDHWWEDRSLYGDLGRPPSDHKPVIADLALTMP